MRRLGGGLLAVSGMLWGLDRARGLARRTERLRELLNFMQFLRTEIAYSAYPLGQLLAMGQNLFSQAAVKRPRFKEDPVAALAEAGRALLPWAKDRVMFQGFVQGLGASDTQGQLEHLALYMTLTESSLKEAREEMIQKRRLYLALGTFAGIAACILIL